MPNVWTHILFAERVAEKAGLPKWKQEVSPFFRLGTQGPDPFFYHNFWPWKKEKPVTRLGQKIHYEQCGPFLLRMIEYGKEHREDERLCAYILGFVTHHILDRTTHPYIIYRSGNEGNRHQKLEVIIDTILMQEIRGIHTWKTPVYKEIDIGRRLYEPIRQMLSQVIEEIFPDVAAEMPDGYLEKSYRDMIKALRILFDPWGWKNRLLGDLISPFSYQKEFPDKDYLNRKRVRWHHPANPDESYTASFDELLKQAGEEGIPILQRIMEYWSTGEARTLAILRNLIGNRSYDTGKDCTQHMECFYFDPIL